MASVLKSESPDEKESVAREVAGLAGFNLNDLADEGRTRLDQCRAQVRQMLDQARIEAEAVRQQADRRGYEEGLARAAADADRKLKEEAELRARDALRLVQQAVDRMHRSHEDWMQTYAKSLSHIALAAAQRVISRRLEQEPEMLVRWAEDAVRSTRAATSLTVAVHPETLATLGEALDELLSSSELPESTHVEPDESVPRDGVVVRQEGGEIEAGLQAQLDRLEELLS